MHLKVNEIFTSVKGEGLYVGKAMTFIRLATCNLHCEGCDTDHQRGVDIPLVNIVERVAMDKPLIVVLTGGEPLIHDSEVITALVAELHRRFKRVHLESNGTMHFNYKMFDWVAVSPKLPVEDTPGLEFANEVKVPPKQFFTYADSKGYPKWGTDATQFLYIQPWAIRGWIPPDEIDLALKLVHEFPDWRYSIQLHKVLGVK